MITPDTADAAWAETQRLLDALDPASIEAVLPELARRGLWTSPAGSAGPTVAVPFAGAARG